MKIVVVGGSGLIGSKLCKKLTGLGHQVMAASPKSGVNTITGEGLAEAVDGAQVVVDVSNAPSWEDAAVMNFFDTSTRNLLAPKRRPGCGIMSHCPWWAPIAYKKAGIFARSSFRKSCGTRRRSFSKCFPAALTCLWLRCASCTD